MTDKHIIDADAAEYEDAPPALREAYKALRKQYDGVVTERDGFRTQLTSRSLADVLGKFKNPKAVERSLVTEGIDPLDSSAVESWLTDNGDDYALAAPGEGTPTPESQLTPEQQAQQAAHAQLSAASGSLVNPADIQKQTLFENAITDEMTGADIRKLALTHGI